MKSVNKMKRTFRAFVWFGITLSFFGCLQQSTQLTSPSNSSLNASAPKPTITPAASSGPPANIMAITVNGALCGSPQFQYANEPCVSVTLCAPGTTNCQTISNLLLDTGSSGLRIFASAITVPLTPVTQGVSNVAECVQYGDGSSQWGQVEMADLRLANEPAIRVPVQVINSNYATAPPPCTAAQGTPDISPAQAGFNGILGVGLFAQDCGAYCVTNTIGSPYYSCNGNVCALSTVPLVNQVVNPVSFLPRDNNGVILQFPAVPAIGAATVTGSLTLGIGTQTNNTPPATVTGYAANPATGEFTTRFSAYSATAIPSFIDSGSSVLFIPPPAGGQLPDCNTVAGGSHGAGYAGSYCPAANQALSALNISAVGIAQGLVPFQVGNLFTLFNSGNAVFSNAAAGSLALTNVTFDWGLPFFFGNTVYVGIENAKSSFGTGPYWAY